jgi:hypothetical protein
MFTGAAVLLRDKAAYRATSFRLQRNRVSTAGLMAGGLESRLGLNCNWRQKGLEGRWNQR